jgi:hypothetical protein
MENCSKDFPQFDKNIVKAFFKDYIEDSRSSIEKKNSRNAKTSFFG